MVRITIDTGADDGDVAPGVGTGTTPPTLSAPSGAPEGTPLSALDVADVRDAGGAPADPAGTDTASAPATGPGGGADGDAGPAPAEVLP